MIKFANPPNVDHEIQHDLANSWVATASSLCIGFQLAASSLWRHLVKFELGRTSKQPIALEFSRHQLNPLYDGFKDEHLLF